MINELGFLALLLAGGSALLQAVTVLFYSRYAFTIRLANQLSSLQFYLFTFAMLILALAFYRNDFTIQYVANHSNTLLPWFYRLAAVWGGHEGSLLLWIVILSAWTFAFSRSLSVNPLFQTRVLGVLAYIQAGFTAFIVFTSNPFQTALPIPFEGSDLNPMLQDVGLIFHPPLLYGGYVGFALAFAFVIAGLWSGKLDKEWLRELRPWTLIAWLTLTLGIALGSYWAYYELGWGGWWFWDPVENASLMPWLVGSALLHTLIASEKRSLLLIWTCALAILAFSLSLMGTFLVRSGVLTSVHAFAADPTRGIFILLLMVVIILPSLILLVWRLPQLSASKNYSLLSKEGGILLNNWVFAGMLFVVFTGTLYPLLADVLNLGKISVGAPYFNRLIIPLAIISLISLGFMPFLRWKKDRFQRVITHYLAIMVFAIFIAGASAQIEKSFRVVGMGFVVGLALGGILIEYVERIFKQGIKSIGRVSTGMVLAHVGYIVMAVAICADGWFAAERDLAIKAGQTAQIYQYEVELKALNAEEGSNYRATVGDFVLRREGKIVTNLKPAKRHYFSSMMPMSESARYVTLAHDIYIALGEQINEQTWAIRLQYKPLISWIWLGGLLMVFGAFFAAWRNKKGRNESAFVYGLER